MTHAELILHELDRRLDAPAELTLYGRAALQLGFEHPPAEYALSKDVDAVLWVGQAEELAAQTNFWDALEAVNAELGECGLYISHLFTEDQVILGRDWRQNRKRIAGPWDNLAVFRLGDSDLFLSKLMRDDPVDRADAQFIVRAANLDADAIRRAIAAARVPDIAEVREQFAICARRFTGEG